MPARGIWLGLNGDVVQFGVILKHLAKYRPRWQITVQAMRGPHSALHGLCHAVVCEGDPVGEQDRAVTLDLEDSYAHFPDRPSNKTVFNLRLLFGLDYDPECGGYGIAVSEGRFNHAVRWLRTTEASETVFPENGTPVFGAVVLHHKGGSSRAKKDLEDWQAEVILDAIRQAGRTPILLDWSGSKLEAVRVPDKVWGGFGNGDAETMAAMIGRCEAFVGIDSGPGKVASATGTPSLIVWTKHHPARYHDPADNTTHLVPDDWRGMQPIEGDAGRERFFAENYHFRTYRGEHGLVHEVIEWLKETLNAPEVEDRGVGFVVPARVLSVAWAAAKLRGIAGDRPIHLFLSGEWDTEHQEAYLLASKFRFLANVFNHKVPYHQGPERPQNTRGHYLYVSDGWRPPYYFLVPDQVMQTGKGLADWLPDVPIDWEAVKMIPDHVLCQMEERGHFGCSPSTA